MLTVYIKNSKKKIHVFLCFPISEGNIITVKTSTNRLLTLYGGHIEICLNAHCPVSKYTSRTRGFLNKKNVIFINDIIIIRNKTLEHVTYYY